jgi:hypothetical protein
MHRSMRPRRLLVGHLLKIVGQNDCGHPPFAECDSNATVYEMPDLSGRGGLLDKRAGGGVVFPAGPHSLDGSMVIKDRELLYGGLLLRTTK